MRDIHIALQFGHIKHFNEGLSEFSRQLALQYAGQARQLKEARGWHFHFILPKQWHGLFGDEVTYHDLTDSMRWRHRFDVPLDVWHGLHQHMRYRPPVNSRHNIITVHDFNHLYAKQGLSLWWQKFRLAKQLRLAQELIAISRFVADDISRHLPGPRAVTVIPNGVADLSQIEHTKPPHFDGADYLLHISRMSASKNVESLINMAAIWPEQPLLLVGPDSPEVHKHREHVASLGLHNVHFLTDVAETEKAWLLKHCKAFVFPSLLEGFGLPPIEAMFFGKPIVVARRSALPSICGQAAGYWDHFDPEYMRQVLASRVQTVSHSIDWYQRITDHAKCYTWQKASASYLDTYARRLNQPSSTAATS